MFNYFFFVMFLWLFLFRKRCPADPLNKRCMHADKNSSHMETKALA